MSLPLLRKELREHGAVVLIALIIGALAHAGLLIQAARTAGRFTALMQYAAAIGFVNALILSNRLLVREYAGRTQLFLETLPVSRTRVFATKWLLGCGIMLAAMYFAWLANLLFIRRTEAVASADAWRTLACVELFALSVWSFAAMAGMLGRYRYAAWVVVLLGVFAANQTAGIQIAELPVLRLIGPDVAMARGMPDTWSLVYAALVFVVCFYGASLLALTGSGAMASALAQKMTTRERVFLVVSLLGGMSVLNTLEPKPVKPPYQLADAQTVRGKHGTVSVLPTQDVNDAQAQALASVISGDVDTLIDALQLDASPSVFVLPQQGLDRTAMQRAFLSDADGIVLKAAPDAPRDSLRSLVLHSVVSDDTASRALKEDRHVLLDGLVAYWSLRDDPAGRDQWWLRVASLHGPLRADDLRRWSQTSERLSECESQALAFAAVDTLVSDIGRERMLALVRSIVKPQHTDVRVAFEATPDESLRRAGQSWTALAAKTEAARLNARERNAAILATRPVVTGTISHSRSATQGVTIETRVQGAPQYWVLYAPLTPWTADVGDPARFDVRGEHAVLPISPPRGSRYLVAIETDDAVLGCPARVQAQRVALP